jgi:transposase
MPAPYSNDLRQKAIEAVKPGERNKDVSEIFNISRNTLDLWLNAKHKQVALRQSRIISKGVTQQNISDAIDLA